MATQNNIIDQVFPETLTILSDLIKFQTVSGTSNLKLIEYCEKKLDKLGAISFKTFHDSKLQANLFSTINGKKKLMAEALYYLVIQMLFLLQLKNGHPIHLLPEKKTIKFMDVDLVI